MIVERTHNIFKDCIKCTLRPDIESLCTLAKIFWGYNYVHFVAIFRHLLIFFDKQKNFYFWHESKLHRHVRKVHFGSFQKMYISSLVDFYKQKLFNLNFLVFLHFFNFLNLQAQNLWAGVCINYISYKDKVIWGQVHVKVMTHNLWVPSRAICS